MSAGGCPELPELLAADARGPLPEALAQVRDELTRSHDLSVGTGSKKQPDLSVGTGSKGQPAGPTPSRAGEALRRAVEADPTLACAGRLAGPLFYAGDHRVAATALADELIHAPQEVAGGVLTLQAELALGLGRREQAEQMLIAAAAAASDPVAVWRRAAHLAARVDAMTRRSFEMGRATSLELVQSAGVLRQAELTLAQREAARLAAEVEALLTEARCVP